jgi:hypothetical protein
LVLFIDAIDPKIVNLNKDNKDEVKCKTKGLSKGAGTTFLGKTSCKVLDLSNVWVIACHQSSRGAQML